MPASIRFGLLFVMLWGLMTGIQAQRQPQSEPSSAIISGRVTIGGKPAPRVAVVVEPSGGTTVNTRLPNALTDEEGNYRLPGVPEGRYLVKPVAPSFVIAEGPGTNQSGSRLHSSNGLVGLILSVARGEVIEGINFQLTRGGVITGRVTDSAGRPVIGAWVGCAQTNEQGSPGNAGGRSDTDDRGVYRIYGLPAGHYLVYVNNAAAGVRRYHQTFHPGVTAPALAVPVAVAEGGEAAGVDIRLGQPDKNYVIRGRVVDETDGQAVPGVTITFRVSSGSAIGTEGGVTADPEGGFEIKDYPPGRYEAQIAFTGGPNKGYYSDPLAFEVTDRDVTGLEVKARRGATISGAVTVEGSDAPSLVNRLSGEWLEAERVQTQEAVVGQWTRPVFLSTRIGPSGAFEFTGVRPGRTRITPGNLPQGFNFIRVERDGVTVTDGMDVLPGERIGGVRVVLAYGTGSIRGQIKVTGGNLPTNRMWRLEVKRASGEQVRYEFLDASGLFWVKGLAPGSYELTATADYVEVPGVTPSPYPAPVKQTVTVEDGTESEVSLVLDLGGENKE